MRLKKKKKKSKNPKNVNIANTCFVPVINIPLCGGGIVCQDSGKERQLLAAAGQMQREPCLEGCGAHRREEGAARARCHRDREAPPTLCANCQLVLKAESRWTG